MMMVLLSFPFAARGWVGVVVGRAAAEGLFGWLLEEGLVYVDVHFLHYLFNSSRHRIICLGKQRKIVHFIEKFAKYNLIYTPSFHFFVCPFQVQNRYQKEAMKAGEGGKVM